MDNQKLNEYIKNIKLLFVKINNNDTNHGQ